MRFITLSRDLFALLEPGWLFTADGITPLTGKVVTRLATLWGGKERNAAVLRNVLMWAALLARGQPRILVDVGGGQQLELKTIPAFADLRVGLSQDEIRLEQMLAGGGGEVVEAEPDDAELEQVAQLQMAGAIEEDEEEQEEEAAPDPSMADEVAEVPTDGRKIARSPRRSNSRRRTRKGAGWH